jgi:hypothetical protein
MQAAAIVLKVCVGLALFLMVLGLGFRGLISIELLNVMQMIYFVVSLLTNVSAPMVPFAQLSELVNGYIYRSEAVINSPSQLLMNVSTQLVGNCNVMLLMEPLMLLVGITLWLLSKRVCNEDNRNLLNRISMLLMKDTLLLLMLFNALNLSYSCGMYLRNMQLLSQSVRVVVFNWVKIVVGLTI